jgi:hypothetical protein
VFQALEEPPTRTLVNADVSPVASNEKQFAARCDRELKGAIIDNWLVALVTASQTQRRQIVCVDSVKEIRNRNGLLVGGNSGKTAEGLLTRALGI